MMKNILIKSGLLLSLAIGFGGCKDELEEKYTNPEKSTDASVPGFFTAILNNNRVKPSYWNVRTFLLLQPAIYTQTTAFAPGNTIYQQSDGYAGQYWSDFYAPSGNGSGVIGMYRAMEVAYAKLSDAEKAKQEVFMQAARIVLFDQASQMVDLWGDIPYTEAANLQKESLIANPKFDSQTELYNTFLTGLKTAATYFSSVATDPTFNKADILLNGNAKKWQSYANSIRLRLLMRVSNVNEAASKPEVLAILGDKNAYPLIGQDAAGDYNPGSVDVLLKPLTNYNDNLRSALTELSSHYAPDYMLNNVMLPANDPRIPVLFDKFGKVENGKFKQNPTYKAMPIETPAEQQPTVSVNYSILDSTTFLENPSIPGIVITASEVNFLKAEAYERWGSSADAQAAYETALRQSVSFYYYLNNLNTTGKPTVAKPVSTVIDAFVAEPTVAYTGGTTDKLAKIWTQKWLHFGVLQSTQAWAEYRRTNYPQLTFPEASLSGYQTPPVRLVYPAIEKSYNTINYKDVQSKDTRTTKIFWDVN